MEIKKGKYLITTDKDRLNLKEIHSFLAIESYWAKGISFYIVKKSIENSLCFGVFNGDEQIGFARVITDYSILAYIADVFIIKEYRGQGLSKWLMETIMDYSDLQNMRRWALTTRDAHKLYKKYGFLPLGHPEKHMELFNLKPYKELT